MSIDLDDPRLTAYALGEIDDPAEIAAVEALLRAHPDARQVVEDIRATGDLLRRELATEHEALPVADLTIRHAVEKALRPRPRRLPWGMLSIAASTLILGGTTFLWMSTQSGEARRAGAPSMAVATAEAPKSGAGSAADSADPATLAEATTEAAPAPSSRLPEPGLQLAQVERGRTEPFYARSNGAPRAAEESAPPDEKLESEGIASLADESLSAGLRRGGAPGEGFGALARAPAAPAEALPELAKVEMRAAPAQPPALVAAPPPPSPVLAAPAAAPAPGAITPQSPPAMIAAAPAPVAAPAAPMPGQAQSGMRVTSALDAVPPPPPPVPAAPGAAPAMIAAAPAPVAAPAPAADNFAGVPPPPRFSVSDLAVEASPKTRQLAIAADREAFAPLVENPFVRVLEQPQSTFALDVDTASYAIVRRYLMSQNALPPKDAVRIEEMVNAFHYDDPAPSGDDPVAVHVEIARSPWSAENRLARIALTGRTIAPKDRPRANLVFLIDVSGSMDEPDKLPLLKRGMRMLTEQLGEGDRVAIVTYSNTARVALPPTRGDQQREILSALESLTPGGSTNGAGGLNLAYEQASAAFIEDGANRVILASDGDFNVGETDNNALVNLIQEKAKSRIFLTVLGFGRGNLQDARLEALADKGNGHYHYIDSPREARRVLVQQVSGTLVTVAKDVKIQVDFNPTKVGAYRLIGFENRLLPASAFRDDTKDGGELGAGHAVCALYELIPSGKEGKLPAADAPQFVKPAAPADPNAPESFVVKLAFKPPDGDISTTRSIPAVDAGKDYAEASRAFRWASAVASFGQILRESSYRGTATLDGVLELAESAKGDDPKGDRKEFLDLVRKAKELGAK